VGKDGEDKHHLASADLHTKGEEKVTTETKQLTCEQRIQANLDRWLEDMRKYNATLEKAHQLNANDAIEELYQRHSEEPIGYSKYTVHKIEYSWGGPQDYFEVWQDDDGEICYISYHFLDWFDGAVRWLGGSDFDIAEEYLRPFIDF